MSTRRDEAKPDEKQDRADLTGHGKGQDARRRWYFAHHHFKTLREHHRKIADQHHREATRRRAEELAHDVRKRNQAKEREYHAALRAYEEKRLEKEDAKEQWHELRREVLGTWGGVRASMVGEDYRDIPVTLRRERGEPLDNIAEHLGFSNADAFERYTASVYNRYRRHTQAEKLERPRRPTFEQEPARVFVRHGNNTRLRHMLSELREMKTMIREGEKELGKNHPALTDLKAAYAETLDEYRATAHEAGERAAA